SSARAACSSRIASRSAGGSFLNSAAVHFFAGGVISADITDPPSSLPLLIFRVIIPRTPQEGNRGEGRAERKMGTQGTAAKSPRSLGNPTVDVAGGGQFVGAAVVVAVAVEEGQLVEAFARRRRVVAG